MYNPLVPPNDSPNKMKQRAPHHIRRSPNCPYIDTRTPKLFLMYKAFPFFLLSCTLKSEPNQTPPPSPLPPKSPITPLPEMDSLRNSFKSYNYKRPPSGNPFDLEHQPILLPDSSQPPQNHADFVVNIDANTNTTNTIWRDSSYDFSSDARPVNFSSSSRQNRNAGMVTDDPPSQLIRKFLHKQKDSGSEVFLDMDFDMEVELQKTPSPSASASASASAVVSPSTSAVSKDFRVSFDQPTFKIRPPSSNEAEAEVLRCTANSYRHNPSAKTRSRLMDPPPLPCSGGADAKKSRLMKSTMLGSVDGWEEDEDDDIPDDFKRAKMSFMTVLQWGSLVLILAGLACTLAVAPARRLRVWSLHVWKWEVMVLVLICGRLVSGWGIRIAIFFIERNFLLRKRVLYFVYGVRRAVQNCLWLGLVLLSWHFMFDKRVERETDSKALPYVTKALFCLLVATLLRLVKTLLVKVLASSFHVSTYFDRIQDSLFNQYVVETLTGPPLIEIQHCLEEEEQVLAEVQKFQNAGATIPNDLRAAALPAKSGRVIGGSGHGTPRSSMIGKSTKLSGGIAKKEEGITVDQLHKLNQKNVSAWNMKRLMRIVRHGALTTLDEQIPQASGEDESAVTIRSEYEAKIAAKKIFQNVAKPGAKYIYLVDLMRFMREEEALKTISLFEEAKENQRISRKSLKNWVVNAFRERRALALTLNDTKTAVNKLHQMANVLVGIIVLAIWLLILGIATTKFFIFLSSQLLLAVFIFGNTLKMVFESIIFLFVMHPFDVGDRCEVEGDQMIVEEMNILTTIFLKADNTKVTYPNTLLATKPISNFYRSPDQGDAIDFCVHVSTPVEKLALMKEKVIGFMESKKEYWYPGPMVVLRDVEDMNRLKISIWLRHRINFQDMGLKFTRRELILQELIRVLREQDIEYRMLPLDVNCRSLPPLSSTRLPSNWTSSI